MGYTVRQQAATKYDPATRRIRAPYLKNFTIKNLVLFISCSQVSGDNSSIGGTAIPLKCVVSSTAGNSSSFVTAAASAVAAAPKRRESGKSRMIVVNHSRRLAGIGLGSAPIGRSVACGAGVDEPRGDSP